MARRSKAIVRAHEGYDEFVETPDNLREAIQAEWPEADVGQITAEAEAELLELFARRERFTGQKSESARAAATRLIEACLGRCGAFGEESPIVIRPRSGTLPQDSNPLGFFTQGYRSYRGGGGYRSGGLVADLTPKGHDGMATQERVHTRTEEVAGPPVSAQARAHAEREVRSGRDPRDLAREFDGLT